MEGVTAASATEGPIIPPSIPMILYAMLSGVSVGDRAMALLPGGGYAAEVVVDAGSLMTVPEGLDLVAAAGLPEVLLTVFLNVFQIGGLGEGDALLVHGGGSGIGTAAIQMAKAAGAKAIVTAGSDEKCQRCLDLGADVAVNYRDGDFVAAAQEATGGKGVDVVLGTQPMHGDPARRLGSQRVAGRDERRGARA